ncbi:MAG: PilZ domain-containing protein [Methylococcales bacterium]|jgi:hypothetical protein|nr:PilZ domain-containing protein [Methylococcales bacterium]
MKERRRHPRINIDSFIELENTEIAIERAPIIDIAVDGIGVLQKQPSNIGQRFNSTFVIPYDDMKKELSASCIVYSISPYKNQFRTGMKILEMSTNDKVSLESFVHSKSSIDMMNLQAVNS